MKTFSLKILVSLLLVHSANCAKILGVFPMPGRSHYILGSALMTALAERGHDVTVISCFGEKEPPKNGTYRDIVVSEIRKNMEESNEKKNMFDIEDANPVVMMAFMGASMPDMFNPIFENKEVQELIRTKEKFDVVIVEQFLNNAQKSFSYLFDAPLVILSSLGANYWINSLVGNPSPPSYIPDILTDFTPPLSFSKRLMNTLVYVFNEVLHNMYLHPKDNERIKKYIPNGPDLYDVLYNASIVLMNSHPSSNQPVPYVPNMIDIGGYHVKPPKKLPKDLQDFLDGATDGVIYFSMGSNLKSADLPVEKRNALLKSFSKLKEKVLWKWEEDVLPGQPSNVKLAKWLPQQDILAHPNVKLFITHGGLLSTIETIYHGVPILAIPIFGDQKLNAKNAVNHGYGLTLPYTKISEETFSQKLEEILNNPKYKMNAKKKSELFHDRLVSPMDTAMYWVEYVIRHKGAPHLRVAGLNLPWYKYLLLDVISFVAFVSFIVLYITYCLFKLVCRKIFSSSINQKLKKH